jgi:hypothetical protein
MLRRENFRVNAESRLTKEREPQEEELPRFLRKIARRAAST